MFVKKSPSMCMYLYSQEKSNYWLVNNLLKIWTYASNSHGVEILKDYYDEDKDYPDSEIVKR